MMAGDLVRFGRNLEGKSLAFSEDSYDLGPAPTVPMFPKIDAIWPLQVDLKQQLGHI